MSSEVFAPTLGPVIAINNAIAATTAVEIPSGANAIEVHNSSATATAYFTVTLFDGVTVPAGTAPTIATGIPVPPLGVRRYFYNKGGKVIRTIATAADGVFTVVPGNVSR